jgi:hypothetical protein
MSVRLTVVGAALAACLVPLAGAAAADLVGPPPSNCAPPPAAIATAPQVKDFRAWKALGFRPYIVDVQRYDPHNPPRAVTPKYVQPQTAYLATPLCNFPDGYSARSWYDGQLFYEQGGVQASPDTFMVIERK